jgi:WD40 repeat protein
MADRFAAQPGEFVSKEAQASESIGAVAVGWDQKKGVAVAVAIDTIRRSSGEAGIGGDTDEEYLRLFELDFAKASFREVSRAAPEDEAAYLVNLRQHGAAGWSAAISPDGGRIVTVGRDEARLWGRDGNELAGFRPHQDLTFAEFSHTGELVVTASLDSSVRVWDAASGVARLTLDRHSAGPLGGPLDGHDKPVNCALFSPDDKFVFTGSEDGTVCKWDLATMRVVHVIAADSQGITRIAISKDGLALFTASRSGLAAIWRLAEPDQPLRRLSGHTGPILDLCLSSDERWIVTASADNTARIWDASTGAELLKLAGHASEVTAVATLADGPGLRVLTGSSDQTAKLWAVTGLGNPPGAAAAPAAKPTVKELLSLKGHTRGLTSVAFAPDGSAALTAARDGLTILWPAVEPPAKLE